MFKKLVIAVMMVMLVSGTAMAGAIATGECTEDYPDDCVAAFTLDDMGTFDETGAWVWDTEFVAVHGGQLECSDGSIDCSYPWMDDFQPQRVTEGITIDQVRVDRRKYADDTKSHTRLVFRVNGESEIVNIPKLWLDVIPAPGEPFGLNMDYQSDGEGNWWIGYREESRVEQPAPAVASTVFNGNLGTEYISQRHEYIFGIKYNTGMRDWEMKWYDEFHPVYHYQFAEQIETAGAHTFTINLANGESYTTNVIADNVDTMPTISAFVDNVQFVKVKPNGKLKAKTKTFKNPDVKVVNISLREVPDRTGANGLVIQWPTPDEALWGNVDKHEPSTFMLRLYIGKWETEPTSKEVYLWVDCPVQTGTVAIRSQDYAMLQDKIIEEGMTTDDIEMFILYRTVSDDTNGSIENPHYHNRGISNFIKFTPEVVEIQ